MKGKMNVVEPNGEQKITKDPEESIPRQPGKVEGNQTGSGKGTGKNNGS